MTDTITPALTGQEPTTPRTHVSLHGTWIPLDPFPAPIDARYMGSVTSVLGRLVDVLGVCACGKGHCRIERRYVARVSEQSGDYALQHVGAESLREF